LSFRCQYCPRETAAQPNATKPVKVITKIRQNKHDRGWQIVEEKNACATHAEEIEDVAATLRAKLQPLVGMTMDGATVEWLKHTALETLLEIHHG